ncbi:TRAP transporter substrate-binding protein [Polycladidibacter stylochi]|uniref:TRAP transporter substrate-binding protein n=1 Tax=Polycladidibacter stylochi TaxID=1807766 RepID=UPI00082EA0B2|nr:TRAP transporter substrate-binding protein [Pseudovibrio stylochi]
MPRYLKYAAAAAFAIQLSTSALAAEFTMKIAVPDPMPGPGEVHYSTTPLMAYAKEIEEKSNGRIDVTIYWNDQLGKAGAVVNMVREGIVEAIMTGDGQIAPFAPDVQVLGVPYLFQNRSIAHEVLDGPAGQMLSDRIAETSGIRPLPWLENGGYRHYSSNRLMKTVDDMKGLKIRTVNNRLHMQIVRSLGANPTPIPWADLYTGLQTGVVDGQENSLSTFRIPKLEEVQKYIILDGHVYSILLIGVSEKWLNTLPEDLRAVINEAAKNMRDSNRRISAAQEASDRKYLEEKGVTVVDVPAEEKVKFRDKTQGDAIKLLKDVVSEDIWARMKSAVEAAEKAQN